MSSEIAISVAGLGKCFQIYDRPHHRLLQMFAGSRHQYFREFLALRDISFEISKGETVGIIGRNGSGKSTLLQIICGTLSPSQGEVRTKGRIAALLELGSGFNPEFTGRENVFMNAAVLGLSRAETDARFADIAAFADIGDFIEQPVKTYSSGMVVRLAFAVAINVDPEILVVDEALSVGDELFQRKCFSRIEAIRASGATILFVSHSGAQIVELCDRAILLDSGEMLAAGTPKEVVRLYQKFLFAPSEKQVLLRDQIRRHEYSDHELTGLMDGALLQERDEEDVHILGDELFDPMLRPSSTVEYESCGAEIGSPTLADIQGRQVNLLLRGELYTYSYVVEFSRPASNVRFGMAIRTMTGLTLGGALSAPVPSKAIPLVMTGDRVEVNFQFRCHLNPGVYFTNAGVFGCLDRDETLLHRKVDVLAFRVMPIHENCETEAVFFEVDPKIKHGNSLG